MRFSTRGERYVVSIPMTSEECERKVRVSLQHAFATAIVAGAAFFAGHLTCVERLSNQKRDLLANPTMEIQKEAAQRAWGTAVKNIAVQQMPFAEAVPDGGVITIPKAAVQKAQQAEMPHALTQIVNRKVSTLSNPNMALLILSDGLAAVSGIGTILFLLQGGSALQQARNSDAVRRKGAKNMKELSR